MTTSWTLSATEKATLSVVFGALDGGGHAGTTEENENAGSASTCPTPPLAFIRPENAEPLAKWKEALANCRDNWDGYGTPQPSDLAIQAFADCANKIGWYRMWPTRVMPSSEGGVYVFFRYSSCYAQIEFLNTGEMIAAFVPDEGAPEVWEFTSATLSDTLGTLHELRPADSPQTLMAQWTRR